MSLGQDAARDRPPGRRHLLASELQRAGLRTPKLLGNVMLAPHCVCPAMPSPTPDPQTPSSEPQSGSTPSGDPAPPPGLSAAESQRLLSAAAHTRQVLLSVVEDQRAAVEALRQSEERFRNLVERSPDWIWEVDADARFTYASPRVRQLLGFSPEEIVGRTPFEFMPSEWGERARKWAARMSATHEPFAGIEAHYLHRDGRLVIVESSGSPSFGADGQWTGYRGIFRDITQRIAAEKALRLRGAALEAAANAIVITDRSGRIEWANPAFTTLSGWAVEEAVGRTPGEILRSGKQDADFFQRMWGTILAGRVWRGEIVNRRKDGSLRTEQMTITPLRDAGGAIAHFIAIKQDITEQKAFEAQSRQGQRMEVIGTLAGGIAHDLNNILAPVLMVTGVLREKLRDQEDQALLEMMEREAQRGASIIKQLLTFGRGAEGQRAIVQPRHILKDVVLMLQETLPREIDVRHQLPAKLWPILADATQLHQVVLNLCVNARDAMPHGGELNVVAENVHIAEGDALLPANAAPGSYVRVEVRDTGSGIDPQIRHRIFDPFFTTKPIGKGTGLGLSTVLAIMQQHGGFITVDSEPGQGAAFKAHFPAAPEESVPLPAPPPPAPAAARGNELIMVVDDEQNVRDVTRAVLERYGYRVVTAVNGQDAIVQFISRRTEVRLVLTDLMMPVMNGLALIKWLRELAPDIPVVAMTGLEDPGPAEELGRFGVAGTMAKPFTAVVLLETVARRLGLPVPPA